jgi:hypothetical protein
MICKYQLEYVVLYDVNSDYIVWDYIFIFVYDVHVNV